MWPTRYDQTRPEQTKDVGEGDTCANLARSSSLRVVRGLVGENGDLTSPEENRFAGDTRGESSADDGSGGVVLRYAVLLEE